MTEVLQSVHFEDMDSWEHAIDEVLEDLLRALKRKKGFGLFFVQCSQPHGERAIETIRQRFPKKQVVKFELNSDSETLYRELLQHYQSDGFDVACIIGIEQALYGYEDTKRLGGWSSQEIYTYSWKGVPPLLSHLNRQREAFEANLPIAIIFFVPSFVVDYFVQRAPDFFDWRSGFFKIISKTEEINKEFKNLIEKDYPKYKKLSSEERNAKILEIKELLQSNNLEDDKKSRLLREQGLLFQSSGDYGQALMCFERAISFKQNYVEALNDQGKTLHELARYEEAISYFDRALEFQPVFCDAWYQRGMSLGSLGRHKEAAISFENALKNQPVFFPAWLNYGVALGYLERHEEAAISFQKALEIQPDFFPAWLNYGIELGYLGRHEEAAESFKRVLAIQPDFYPALHNYGITASYLEHYEEANEIFTHALKIQPDLYPTWHYHGLSLQNLERDDEAIKSFEKALEMEPNSYKSWYRYGISLHNLERNKEAVESLERALDIQPNSYMSWYYHGISLHHLDRNEEAIKSLERALEIQPQFAEAWELYGVLNYILCKTKKAHICFTKVSDLNPEDSHSWNNQGYLALAEYAYGLQPVFGKPLRIQHIYNCINHRAIDNRVNTAEYKKNLAAFDVALTLSPNLTLALANKSFPLYYLQEYQAAIDSCNQVFAIDPSNIEEINDIVHINRGCCLLQIKKPDEALENFTAAIEIDTLQAEAWNGKGTALFQLGRYVEAYASFERALTLKHPLAQENLELTQPHLSPKT